MFFRLLTADLVIADVSIENANVFYELGLRHAARDKRTFLMRCRTNGPSPFDLMTDRYFSYDKDKPAGSIDDLVKAIEATVRSEGQDSPFFQLLPGLEALNRAPFLIVPRGFREEVERASATGAVGDLQLLGEEISEFEWASEGLRIVGRGLCGLQAFEAAVPVWETILRSGSADEEANIELGTLYLGLKDFVRSD